MTPREKKEKVVEPELIQDSREVKGQTAVAPYDPLQRYIAEIRQFKPLSRGEEERLAKRFKEKGDREAARRLILSNLWLVVKIAVLLNKAAMNVMDLIQEGNIGLMKALQRFDPYRGIRLPTYASWWIKAYILKFILDNWRMVKIGTTNERRRLLFNLKKEKKRLEDAGFTVGPKLLAESLNVSEKDVIDVEKGLGASDISIDAPVREDSQTEFSDFFSDEKPLPDEKVSDRQLSGILKTKYDKFAEMLSERDRFILEKRLLAEDPITLREIGEKFKITREAVRQSEKKLISNLKAFMRRELSGYRDFRFIIKKDQG
jgi:RNA polymerase sigma-32 factor